MARDDQEEKVYEMMGEMYDMIASLARRLQALEEGLEKLQEELNKEKKVSQERYEHDVGVDIMLEEFHRFNPKDHGMSGKLVIVSNVPRMKEAQGSVIAESSQLGPTGGIGKKRSRSKKKGGSTMIIPSLGTIAVQLCSKCGRRHGKRACTYCYTCGKPGHIAKYCFQNRLSDPTQPNLTGSVTSLVPTVLPLADQKQKEPLL